MNHPIVHENFQKIIHQQFHVKRVADAALDIYASAATMSRATAGMFYKTFSLDINNI